jgi:hypothetical protein
MFTQALGVSEGLIPNREVFAYYGPGSALIHGLVIHIFGNQLLVLRVFTGALILLTAHFMYRLLNFAVQPFLSFGLVITWSLVLGSNFPWASAITTLFILFSIYIMVRPSTSSQHSIISIAIASSIIALGSYIRIHLVVITVLVWIWYLVIERKFRVARIWILSSFVTHLSVIALMILFKSFSGFLSDSVIYPSSVRVLTSYPKSYLVGLLWYPILWLVLTLGTILFQKLISLTKFRVLGYLQVVISGLLILLLVLHYYRLPRVGNVTYLNPRIVLIDGSWMLLCGTGYASLILVFLLCTKLNKIRKESDTREDNYRFLLPIAIGASTQLYPLYDRFHLWYLAPIFIIGAVLNLDLLKIDIKKYKHGLVSVLIFLTIFQSFVIVRNFDTERFSSKSLVLNGMLMSKNKQTQIDNSVKFITKYSIYRKTSFDCANGFFAGATGKYLANDSNFVNWGPKKYSSLTLSRILIVCKSTPNQIEKYLAEGWVLLGRQKWSNSDRKLPALYNFSFRSSAD